MESSNYYKRHIFYFIFENRKNTVIVREEINSINGENKINVRTAQKWLFRFFNENFKAECIPK